MNASDIHHALRGRWPTVLKTLGIQPENLRNRHGPCPACGGTDRYRFDDRRGRGDFYCNGCGPGDGFALLQRVYGWSFSQARQAVIEAALLDGVAPSPAPVRLTLASGGAPVPAKLTSRARDLLQNSSLVDKVADAVDYLRTRRLWPLPADCSLRAHAGTDYWHANCRVGLLPALVAPVVEIGGELVSAHVTYLSQGRKLTDYPTRKLICPLVGHQGCAVRLLPLAGEILGIAEGIETALAAAVLHDGVPAWAAINTSLLARWQPPEGVRDVLIFADRDDAGLKAAWKLADTLDGRVAVDVRVPPAPAKDWADVLHRRNRR